MFKQVQYQQNYSLDHYAPQTKQMTDTYGNQRVQINSPFKVENEFNMSMSQVNECRGKGNKIKK